MNLYVELFFWFTVFSLFHSITAHEWFKEWLAKYTGQFFVDHFWRLLYCIISWILLYECAYRIMYTLGTGELLVEYPYWLKELSIIVRIAGFVIAFWAYVQFDYFEFWGGKQAYRGIVAIITRKKVELIPLAGVERLEVRGIYNFCRHPMLTGAGLIILASPPNEMTLVYFLLYITYMFIGAYYEEKRLVKNFGNDYLEYRKQVGAFLPNIRQVKAFCRKFI